MGRLPHESGTNNETSRRDRSSATSVSVTFVPDRVGYSTNRSSPKNVANSRSASTSRKFTGIHTGPRQLELPPNSPLVDSAGSYPTAKSLLPSDTVNGLSRCERDSVRSPYGDRNS